MLVLSGQGTIKERRKKNPSLSGMKKKILEENLFFYSRWEYCSIIFHTRNFATIKDLFYTSDFAFCSCTCKIQKFNEKGEKKYPTSCRHAKKVFPPTYSRMIRLRFCEPRSPCVRTFGIRTTLFFCLYVSKR